MNNHYASLKIRFLQKRLNNHLHTDYSIQVKTENGTFVSVKTSQSFQITLYGADMLLTEDI